MGLEKATIARDRVVFACSNRIRAIGVIIKGAVRLSCMITLELV
jgi:hypothetical protein